MSKIDELVFEEPCDWSKDGRGGHAVMLLPEELLGHAVRVASPGPEWVMVGGSCVWARRLDEESAEVRLVDEIWIPGWYEMHRTSAPAAEFQRRSLSAPAWRWGSEAAQRRGWTGLAEDDPLALYAKDVRDVGARVREDLKQAGLNEARRLVWWVEQVPEQPTRFACHVLFGGWPGEEHAAGAFARVAEQYGEESTLTPCGTAAHLLAPGWLREGLMELGPRFVRAELA